jgi:hypothetical protein
MLSTTTADDGSFAMDAWEGIGSVTWVLIVPIFQGPGRLPPVEAVYVEVEADGRTTSVTLHPRTTDQKPQREGGRAVELGTIQLSLMPRAAAGSRPRRAGRVAHYT